MSRILYQNHGFLLLAVDVADGENRVELDGPCGCDVWHRDVVPSILVHLESSSDLIRLGRSGAIPKAGAPRLRERLKAWLDAQDGVTVEKPHPTETT